MIDNKFIFLAGLHRSGTSLLHEILREHSKISGFLDTGAIEDEGQFLQTVYLRGESFGGPGRFGFDKNSFMDESHPLATEENSSKLFNEWSEYWNTDAEFLIEKSPPNIVRTRYFQKLFPNSIFVIILRHPIAVSYATQKWSKTDIPSLIEHYLRCYERFLEDMPFLNNVYVLRYEDFISNPQQTLNTLYDWIGIEPTQLTKEVKLNINDKYFKYWENDMSRIKKGISYRLSSYINRHESRTNVYGYSLKNRNELLPVNLLGAHKRT